MTNFVFAFSFKQLHTVQRLFPLQTKCACLKNVTKNFFKSTFKDTKRNKQKAQTEHIRIKENAVNKETE